MEQGRRYRPHEQIFVRDWNSFKKVWRNTSFMKDLGQYSSQNCKNLIIKNLDQLISDQIHHCYVFPDSLKIQYVTIFIDLISSQKYNYLLDYEYEGLYLNKAKQLVVFRKRTSVAAYLSKYRLPDQYRKLFTEVLESWKQYLMLMSQRNILISKQVDKQQIQKLSTKMREYNITKLQPKLKIWRELIIKILQDFKKQPKKDEILLIGVNSIIGNKIKQLCIKYELYYGDRYQKVSQYDQYRDITITKIQKNNSASAFDDQSQNSDLQNYQESQVIFKNDLAKQIYISIPKNIQNVQFLGYHQNGAKCSIFISAFGKANPVQYILVRLIYPLDTQQQKKYIQKIGVSQGGIQYQVILHCLHLGVSIYQIKTCNSAGECKNPYVFKIWQQGIPSSVKSDGLMKVNKQNYELCILGQNDGGLIPNPNGTENILRTTEQKWLSLKFQCLQYSISSHIVICNNEGQVAGWGKMYYYDDNKSNEDENINDEQQQYNPNKSQIFRIQKPSLILQNQFIRKVSCGQGYCLMVDLLGRAWAFGINIFGQLGLEHNDQDTDTSQPTVIQYFRASNIFVSDVVASSFGASFALDERGQVYRWGTNQIEQSNRPVMDSFNNVINFQYPDVIASQSLPTIIGKKSINQKIVSIHPGMKFVLALSQGNRVYGWGNTKYLGLGTVEDAHFKLIQNICNPIPILQNVKKVSVGDFHCLALKMDGSLVGWGQSEFFQENKGSQKIYDKPNVISTQFKGFFTCGNNFTVLENEQKGTMRILGNRQIFKQIQYKLPFKPVQVKAGEGVVLVMGKIQNSIKSSPKKVSPSEPN